MWLCHARALAVLALFVCPQTKAADALSGTPITPALRKIALLALNQDRDPPHSTHKHASVLPRLDAIRGVVCAATGEDRCYQVTHAFQTEWSAESIVLGCVAYRAHLRATIAQAAPFATGTAEQPT